MLVLQDQESVTDQRRDNPVRQAGGRLPRTDISTIEIAAAAYALIMDEVERGIPETNRRTYEGALRDAMIILRASAKVKGVVTAAAKKVAKAGKAGGAANDTDADLLDRLIGNLVSARPQISLVELRLYLRACQYRREIVEVSSRSIVFALPKSRGGRRPARTVACSLMDLKARLAKARKEAGFVRARQARAKTSQTKAT